MVCQIKLAVSTHPKYHKKKKQSLQTHFYAPRKTLTTIPRRSLQIHASWHCKSLKKLASKKRQQGHTGINDPRECSRADYYVTQPWQSGCFRGKSKAKSESGLDAKPRSGRQYLRVDLVAWLNTQLAKNLSKPWRDALSAWEPRHFNLTNRLFF